MGAVGIYLASSTQFRADRTLGLWSRDRRTTASMVTARSWETIETHHLRSLARIAIDDLEGLFRRHPRTGDLYRNRQMLLLDTLASDVTAKM